MICPAGEGTYGPVAILVIMRLTLKAINDELKRLAHSVELEKGDGYFYFKGCVFLLAE